MIAPPNCYHNWEGVRSLYGLDGYSIVESPHCTKSEERTITRSWRERLFSWPWRPWQTMKTVTVQVADEYIYVTDGMIMCHPVIAQQLRDALPLQGAAL